MRRSSWLSLAVITPLLLLQCGRDRGEEQGEAKSEGAARSGDENLVVLTEAQENTAHLTVTAAGADRAERRLQVTGEIEPDPDRVARVSSPIGGRLIRVLTDLGATVRSGQTLALMDSQELGDAEVAYLKSVAAEETARKSLNRARMLIEREAISVAELQQREAQEDQDTDDRGAHVAALEAHLRGRSVHVVHGLVRVARAGDGRQAERRHGQVPEDHGVLQAPLEAVPAEGLGLGGPGKQAGQAGEDKGREHEHHEHCRPPDHPEPR